MANFTVYFKVKALCCDDHHNECGFIAANTLAEAVEQLEEYFKNDLVAVTHLELVDTPLITMPEDVAESVLEYNF